jgi:DNA repair protein RadC
MSSILESFTRVHPMAGLSALPTREERQLWRPLAGTRIARLADVEAYVRSLPSEHFQSLLALYVDARSHLLATENLGRRNSAEGRIKPMPIIKRAQGLGAMGFVIVYYDPIRTWRPSAEEIMFARDLRRTGEGFDTYLLHYLIIGAGRIREVAG